MILEEHVQDREAAQRRGRGRVSFAIAVARFYEDLADRLVAGAQRAFADAGEGEADVFDVPGAFELPPAALYLASSGRYEGVACLGAVIRGETDHYVYVCGEAARGIQDVQLRTGVPCALRRADRGHAWSRPWPGRRGQARYGLSRRGGRVDACGSSAGTSAPPVAPAAFSGAPSSATQRQRRLGGGGVETLAHATVVH